MGDELRTERELSLDFLRVCEAAAIAAARTMGQGDRKFSDHVAVEAMREVMDTVPMRGRVVIGEANAMKRRCSTSVKRSEAALASARRLPNRALKLISLSTHSKAQIFARSVRTTRLPCSRQQSVAACSTRLTFTWTRSWLDHRHAASWISTRR